MYTLAIILLVMMIVAVALAIAAAVYTLIELKKNSRIDCVYCSTNTESKPLIRCENCAYYLRDANRCGMTYRRMQPSDGCTDGDSNDA